MYVCIVYVAFSILPNFYLSQSFAQVTHHGQKYQQHLSNDGKNMRVEEILAVMDASSG